MDKEKDIEKIACILTNECKSGCVDCLLLTEYGCNEYDDAKRLVEAGIGDKKQAVKEFAEKLKEQIVFADDIDLYPHYADGYNRACDAIKEKIDELIKELYGEE